MATLYDDQSILDFERLRDSLLALRDDIRARFGEPSRQVIADELKKRTAELAEAWLVDLSQRQQISEAVPSGYLGELSVEFQRLLTYSQRSTIRRKYDRAIAAILKDYTASLVIPLKQRARQPARLAIRQILRAATPTPVFAPTAFVGHSFAVTDSPVNDFVIGLLNAIGVTTETGKRPLADRISDKIKRRIDAQHIFVGIFTRRDKLAKREQWTTSQWVLDEKVYASTNGKPLILLKEKGVGSIGGIQGDYEYFEFDRERLSELALELLAYFELSTTGLRNL